MAIYLMPPDDDRARLNAVVRVLTQWDGNSHTV
jgi:hypothetical protein